jgi:hypothetical protein
MATSTEKARAALAANPFPPSPWLQVTDDEIIIKSSFSEQLLQLLRWVPKVQWRPDKRYWTVPIAGAEAVRAVLPEITRLAELTQPSLKPSTAAKAETPADLFRNAARMLFGGDWQRDTARALELDETALVRWLLGEHQLEDEQALLSDMLALMRRRAAEIAAEADRFEAISAQMKQRPTSST